MAQSVHVRVRDRDRDRERDRDRVHFLQESGAGIYLTVVR